MVDVCDKLKQREDKSEVCRQRSREQEDGGERRLLHLASCYRNFSLSFGEENQLMFYFGKIHLRRTRLREEKSGDLLTISFHCVLLLSDFRHSRIGLVIPDHLAFAWQGGKRESREKSRNHDQSRRWLVRPLDEKLSQERRENLYTTFQT